MMHVSHRRIIEVRLLLLSILIGCHSAENATQPVANPSPTVDTEQGQNVCNPLAPELDCLFPFPSDFFLDKGRFGQHPATVLTTVRGDSIVLNGLESDGFPVYPSIVFQVARPVSSSSLSATRTMLLNTETHMEVPHRLEFYEGADLPATYLAIRPATRLAEATRYIVAIGSIQGSDMTSIVAPSGFKKIREGISNPTNKAQVEHYESKIFPLLDKAGMNRKSLHLVWDFTTRSRDDLMGKMLDVRAQTLAWLNSETPTLKDVEVVDGQSNDSPTLIRGRFTAPKFVESDTPGTDLLYDGEGNVTHEGLIEVDFVINIPASVFVTNSPASFLQFGHGFFGTCAEATSGTQNDFTARRGYILGCTNWSGMTIDDGAYVLGKLASDPANTAQFVPRVYQAMVNQLVFTHAARAVARTQAGQFDGGSPMWHDDIEFFGISQGHILGGVIAALSPEFTRTVLHVGGAGFGLIMTRSTAFEPFNVLLRSEFAPLEALKFQSLLPIALERIDPVAYAPLIIREPLPDNPPKQILLQAALGDSQVPNLATELHANALDVPVLTPSPGRRLFSGPEASYPQGSGLAYYDVGVAHDWATRWRDSAGMNVGHDGLRATPQARSQMDTFLQAGLIENPCDGVCILDL